MRRKKVRFGRNDKERHWGDDVGGMVRRNIGEIVGERILKRGEKRDWGDDDGSGWDDEINLEEETEIQVRLMATKLDLA